MKNRIKIVSILIASLFIVSGILFVFRKQIKLYLFPNVAQIGEVTIRIENDTAYVISKLSATNKSPFKIKIDSIKYTIALINKVYLQSHQSVGLALSGYGLDTIDFNVKIPFQSILHDLKEQRKRADSTGYSIHVNLQVSTVIGKSEVPIALVGKIKIPQPPELEIVEIKYNGLRLKFIQSNVKIKVSNFNTIGLTI